MLPFIQKIPAPVDERLQGLLTRQRCATTAGQQTKPVVEMGGDLLHRHHPQPRGSQFQSEGNSIQATNDFSQGRRVVRCQDKIWPDSLRAGDEKLNRLRTGDRIRS